jgi:hypothetical protein
LDWVAGTTVLSASTPAKLDTRLPGGGTNVKVVVTGLVAVTTAVVITGLFTAARGQGGDERSAQMRSATNAPRTKTSHSAMARVGLWYTRSTKRDGKSALGCTPARERPAERRAPRVAYIGHVAEVVRRRGQGGGHVGNGSVQRRGADVCAVHPDGHAGLEGQNAARQRISAADLGASALDRAALVRDVCQGNAQVSREPISTGTDALHAPTMYAVVDAAAAPEVAERFAGP